MTKITDFLSSDRAKKIIIIGGIAVILLLFLSTLPFGEREETPAAPESTGETERALEQRLEKLLSQIDGVGEVSVMITLEGTSTRVFAEETRTESSSSGGAESSSQSSGSQTEIVLAGSGKEPVETNIICPKVRGVAVVCGGAADPIVREKIANTVSGVLNVGLSRIYVTG